MEKLKIIVTDDRHGSYEIEEKVLREIGADIEVHESLAAERAAAVLRDADGVLCNLFPMDAACVRSMEKCRIISRYGVGYDNVDVDAAAKQGIWVSNVPGYASEAVSEHALALLLGCVRRITARDRGIRKGEWNIRDNSPVNTVKGSVLGIIGFGRSGSAFVGKVSALGPSKILVYDPFVGPETIASAGCTSASFEEIIVSADYISIHAPLNEQTKGMFNRDVFTRMKNTAMLINTARGPLVNEGDLAAALLGGEIAYAGLDVYEQEPLPTDSPLRQPDNVILSDHAGWYSEESLEELKRKAALNILETFRTGRPLYPVNQAKYSTLNNHA
jgi:D-3-phosphoglycerate dehydrogenase / 2-oxoglutarate reductase